MTRVVNVKYTICDVYIGRANSSYGFEQSKFANPYHIGKDGNRDKVLEKYDRYLSANPELIDEAIKELDGKTLGCWCSPQRCHGHVLIERMNKRKEELNL